jgi:hypothetical protein
MATLDDFINDHPIKQQANPFKSVKNKTTLFDYPDVPDYSKFNDPDASYRTVWTQGIQDALFSMYLQLQQ